MTSLRSMMIAIATAACAAASLQAQNVPQNYSDFYRKNVKLRSSGNVNTYLFDRYFYSKPSVSPYLNLSRRETIGGDAYTSWVRPEQQRRQAAESSMRSYVQQRKMAGNVGYTNYSNATGATRPATPGGNRPYSQLYRRPY